MSSKVVVITGASAGIGAEFARQLGRAGHQVVLSARGEAALKAVAASIGPNALPVVADVTKRAQVEALRDAALTKFGRVDVWVNNAGQGITRQTAELTDDDVDQIVAVDLKSVLYGVQAILPHFQQRGTGLIVNVSSMLGKVPFAPHRSIYSATKAAVNSLSSNLRMDLARTHPGIKVTTLLPGVVRTEFGANSIGGSPPLPPGTPSQSVEEVAAVMMTLLDNPVPELVTNPAMRDVVLRYFSDVGAFEASLGAPPSPR
jgi:short-subunit dehydrogenase